MIVTIRERAIAWLAVALLKYIPCLDLPEGSHIINSHDLYAIFCYQIRFYLGYIGFVLLTIIKLVVILVCICQHVCVKLCLIFLFAAWQGLYCESSLYIGPDSVPRVAETTYNTSSTLDLHFEPLRRYFYEYKLDLSKDVSGSFMDY